MQTSQNWPSIVARFERLAEACGLKIEEINGLIGDNTFPPRKFEALLYLKKLQKAASRYGPAQEFLEDVYRKGKDWVRDIARQSPTDGTAMIGEAVNDFGGIIFASFRLD